MKVFPEDGLEVGHKDDYDALGTMGEGCPSGSCAETAKMRSPVWGAWTSPLETLLVVLPASVRVLGTKAEAQYACVE